MPSFHDFPLQPATLAVLAAMKITEPTAIQAEAIPALLAGSDVVGQSATGSGKTLAYGIPLVERIAKSNRAPQALVLVPTRELAVQVSAVLSKLTTPRKLSIALLVGGRPYGSQISALRYGSQIIVGTPGRVKDHLDRGTLVLNQLRMCVLDEADQMLDIGFAPIIEEILVTTPETRQMALFSATMPDWIAKLQKKFLTNPVKVDITAAPGIQSTIEQIAYQVPHEQKMAALCTLLHSTAGESSLIFGKTKFGVEKLGKQLTKLGFAVGTLHGDKSQRAREEVLTAFRRGQVQTLLATNVAARGLDIQGIYQVINYELPESSDLFTHRIGRTGRMGHQGKAITLLVPSDVPKWRRMAHNLGQTVALQRLVINQAAMEMVPSSVTPEAFPVTPEREQYSEQRQTRNRKPFSPYQEREQGSEQYSEQRQIRSRKPFSPNQEREQDSEQQWQTVDRKPFSSPRPERVRRVQPAPDSYTVPVANPVRHQRENIPSRAQAVLSESFILPERPSSSRARDGRNGTSRPSSFGKSTGRYKDKTATEQPYRSARTTPVAYAKKRAAAKRSAGR